jgi:hypothetical protein
MARLRRFENHRYVGTRDDMVVYDCDDANQFATLEERIEADDLVNRDLLQAFGPDEPAEARNRGFRLAG